jgi:hypothetical protein
LRDRALRGNNTEQFAYRLNVYASPVKKCTRMHTRI